MESDESGKNEIKRWILETAGKRCQCTHRLHRLHPDGRCINTVNIGSHFVWVGADRIYHEDPYNRRVICGPCFNGRHRGH